MPDTYETDDKAPKRQAEHGQRGSEKALCARPVKGKIDYDELSREHIARHPKIRARLAE